MATFAEALQPEAGPSRLSIPAPAFQLDLVCPITLPARPTQGISWPYPFRSHGHEAPSTYIRRRYFEAAYLPEAISPLHYWLLDMQDMLDSSEPPEPSLIAQTVQPLLRTLHHIEHRHRKAILPLLTGMTSVLAHSTSDALSILAETEASSGLERDEIEVVRLALDMRMNSRRATEGDIPSVKSISQELERRETLLQVILLLLLIQHVPTAPAKKRKRENRILSNDNPLDDPRAAVEILMDRLGVWYAVAELGLSDGASHGGKSTSRSETGMQTVLQGFWKEIMIPYFVPALPDLSAAFYQKVFGHPMPPAAGSSSSKKPRKPKITHARPSSDALTNALPTARPRQTSRAPSEAPSRASNEDRQSLQRSMSRTFESVPADSRSRSRSIDPVARPESRETSANNLALPKRPLGRAPSSTELFKGRQVGLMRRTTSIVGRKDKKETETQHAGKPRPEESQNRLGLLGRRRPSDESLRAGQIELQKQSQSAGTIIFATPSKPKMAETLFGPRRGAYQAPTPIQEEPSSGERSVAKFFVETPIQPGRQAGSNTSRRITPFGIPDTPRATPLADIPARLAHLSDTQLTSEALVLSSTGHGHEDGDESDDPLAGLMVMTDDEEASDSEDANVPIGFRLVPETPAK